MRYAFAIVGLSIVHAAAIAADAAPPPNAPPATPAAMNTPGASAPATPAVLGRLFFTPAERAALDEARRRPTAVVAVPAEKPPGPPPPEFVTLNGVVRRNDGTTTVWLNNKPVTGSRSEEGLVVSRATAPGAVTVRVPEVGRSVNLRVGQQVEVNSGKVEEGYRLANPRQAAQETPVKPDAASDRADPRRSSSRQRELLRDLLREIDGPAPPPGSAPSAAPPG
jgi:hypothetical protein